MVKHQHLLKLETRLVILHQNQEFLNFCQLANYAFLELSGSQKKRKKVQRILSDISLSPLGS